MQRLLLRVKEISLASVLAISILSFSSVALAQNSNTGEIKGTVSDPSGAVVPGVDVQIKNVQTGVITHGTTNGAGLYDVPFLAPGDYAITFSNQGFNSFVRQGIVLQVQTLEVSATLQIGTATQEVVVNSAPPLLETESSDQHVDLSAHQIETAPVVGTNWETEMTQLIPGVNNGGGSGEAVGQSIGVNGTAGYNVNFLIDGSSATEPRDFNSSNNYMPLDSIQEISIDASNAPAQYGNGLTSVNVITKGGTNDFHGSAYEFVQNTAFNARGFYNQTGPKSIEHWNNYGASVGGPIIKNKLFFFFNYQRNPSTTPVSGLYTYPTAAMQAGDFYGVPGSTGSAFSSTGQLLGAYDSVALKLQGYFPKAGSSGWVAGCPGPAKVGPGVPQTCPTTNNYIFNGSAPNLNTWYTGRLDYNISDKQKLSFTENYFPVFVTYVPPDPLYPSDASAISQANNYNFSAQFTDVYTISATTLNEFRFGGVRELDSYQPPSLNKNDPQTLGLEPQYGSNIPANMFPKITIDQGSGVGCIAEASGCGENGNIDALLGDGTYNASDVVTLVRGRHTIKIGGELDKNYQNYTGWPGLSSGSFEFNGSVTGVPYADFLAGDVYGWYVYEYDATSAYNWNSALFASDDFQLTPHLTLNVGLRWQGQSGWGVKHDAFGVFDPNLPNPDGNGVDKGGILYGGQSDPSFGGKLNTIESGNYKEFAPRIGFAWSPSDKWSFRGSYGVFDAPRDAENYTDGALGLGLNPHSYGSAQGYVYGSAAFKLASGPAPGSVVYPTIQTLSSTLNNYSSVTYYPRNMPIDRVTNVLASVQRQLPGGMLLDTSYVFTHGTNLNFATNIDQPLAGSLSCTAYLCGNPNPLFTAIQAQNYTGWSNYNALQVRFQKRTSYGVSFQFNYAFSRSIDTGTGSGHGSGVDIYQNAYSPAANYGLSDFNATHTLAGQFVYEVPFGKGRQFALHGVLDEVLGGWRLSGVLQWHTGTPFTPIIQSSVAEALDPALASALSNGTTLFPQVAGNPVLANPTLGQWFNSAAYTNPAPGTFGDSGRNTLIGPSFTNLDLSFGKTFILHWERLKLDVRADAFNSLNHINYANPDADVGYLVGTTVLADSEAGKILGPSSGNRIIQLGAHLTF
ncbi:MAG: TonB-dependent receptor [Bryobacteraceae bacterium]